MWTALTTEAAPAAPMKIVYLYILPPVKSLSLWISLSPSLLSTWLSACMCLAVHLLLTQATSVFTHWALEFGVECHPFRFRVARNTLVMAIIMAMVVQSHWSALSFHRPHLAPSLLYRGWLRHNRFDLHSSNQRSKDWKIGEMAESFQIYEVWTRFETAQEKEDPHPDRNSVDDDKSDDRFKHWNFPLRWEFSQLCVYSLL